MVTTQPSNKIKLTSFVQDFSISIYIHLILGSSFFMADLQSVKNLSEISLSFFAKHCELTGVSIVFGKKFPDLSKALTLPKSIHRMESAGVFNDNKRFSTKTSDNKKSKNGVTSHNSKEEVNKAYICPLKSWGTKRHVGTESPKEHGIESPKEHGIESPKEYGIESPEEHGIESPKEYGIELPK